MKTIHIIVLASAAVALSVACSVFFLKAGKPIAQHALSEARIARTDDTQRIPPVDASRQPVRQKPLRRKTSSPKPVEAASSDQQAERQPKQFAPKVIVKPQTDANALPTTAAKNSALEKQITEKFDQMFAAPSSDLFQNPFSAAHSLVEKEPVDQSWAPEASRLLADSFSDLSGSLNISVINCRTNICEMRINSWPGENYDDINLAEYRLEYIKEQPWFKQYFDETTSWSSFLEDGLPLMVIYFSRK